MARRKSRRGSGLYTGSRGRQIRTDIRRQREMGRVFRRIILILIIIIAALYIAGVVWYRGHFYSGGTIFGMEMRNATVEELKEGISKQVGKYELNVNTRDGVETITADEVGLVYDDQGQLDQMLEDENEFLWFLMMVTTAKDTEIDVAYDEAKLTQTLEGLKCMQDANMQAPVDAYLAYQTDSFKIVPESYGNKLKKEQAAEAISEAILSGKTEISLDELSCYEMPEIYEDNEKLAKECEELNDLVDVTITYDFSDRTWVVDGSVLSEMINYNEDFTFELDEEKVAAYVHSMAYETDTFGLSRTFKTHGGSEIKLKGGDYGWCMNQSKTTEQLLELIAAGEDTTVEPIYRYSGICRDTNDIGGNYVEISISAQTMWVYKDGQCIVETPVVTGNTSKGNGTPSGGVWAVDARITDYTLSGQDYNTEVKYWLPFNGNVGIHDADWRSQFGGSIYKTSGSHGCVNTPPSIMPKVYENVKIGYPIVVY